MPRTTQSINVGAEVVGISRRDAEVIAGRVEQYLLDNLSDLPEFWRDDAQVLNHDFNVETGTDDA